MSDRILGIGSWLISLVVGISVFVGFAAFLVGLGTWFEAWG